MNRPKFFSACPLLLSALLLASPSFAGTGNTGEGSENPDLTPAVVDSARVANAGTILASDLRKHLEVLASNEYEGRETGEKGQKMAAEYITNYFESIGLEPVVNGSYVQPFDLRQDGWGEVYIDANGNRFEFLQDFYGWPGTNDDLSLSAEEVVFVGYGIDDEEYSDYEGMDVNGKIVVFSSGEPYNKDGNSVITGGEKSAWSTEWRKKLDAATNKGAKAILVVSPYVNEQMQQKSFVSYLKGSSLELAKEGEDGSPVANTLYISTETGLELLGMSEKKFDKHYAKIDKKGKARSMVIEAAVEVKVGKETSIVQSENVMGFLPGTDLKDEIIVVSAHYDHIGRNEEEIFNGADDDGSGTVSVLEIAQAMTTAADAGFRSRRSILFMTVSGEEKGLLGSEYYTDNPIFPLESTVTNLNIDMVGRLDKEHEEDPDYVYVIGSDYLSTELHAISEETAANYSDVALDYRYNAKDDPNRFYYRSDHYNFAKNNIPVIFYFNGTHNDYHQSTDTVEKIEFDVMAKRAQLIYHTLWEVANADKRPAVDVEQD